MDEALGLAARAGLVGVALIGGSLFAFSAFIMAALRRLPDAEGVRIMQEINRTVFTPWFMVPFFGTAVLSLGAVVAALGNTDRGWWLPLLSAGLLYGIGVFGVTAFGNVPLNNKLAGMEASDASAAAFWRRYGVVWTRWNHSRVVASVGSLLCLGETLRIMGVH